MPELSLLPACQWNGTTTICFDRACNSLLAERTSPADDTKGRFHFNSKENLIPSAEISKLMKFI